MEKLEIRRFVLGPVMTNVYLAVNTETQETLIFDPGAQADGLIRYMLKEELQPRAILLTHGHYDHIGAVDAIRDRLEIPVYAFEAEKELLTDGSLNRSLFHGDVCTAHVDYWLKDREELEIAGFRLFVLHTPGHTPGGCCYYFPDEKALFSGDTLFRNSVGRTDFPKGSMSELIRGIRDKLLVLPDDTAVYPGHGDMTDIGYEKVYNPFIV